GVREVTGGLDFNVPCLPLKHTAHVIAGADVAFRDTDNMIDRVGTAQAIQAHIFVTIRRIFA
ncbi:hypothetical protein SB679_25220, partial [Chryseobacterium sp. SIMBA_029]